MSIVEPKLEIYYPESDGQPMGETDLHIHWMIRVRDVLKRHYRGQQVYVASNLLLYYTEGLPQHVVVPDVFVVKDCDPTFRRVYKLWAEKLPPNVAFEITSKATRREDESFKPDKYMQIGVKEYFLYDPSGDYLEPTLQGFRFDDGEIQRIERDDQGRLHCQELNLWLRSESGDLIFYDANTGQRLLTGDEAEEVAKQAAVAAKEAELIAREAAIAARETAEVERVARQAAEAELQKLREELRRSQ